MTAIKGTHNLFASVLNVGLTVILATASASCQDDKPKSLTASNRSAADMTGKRFTDDEFLCVLPAELHLIAAAPIYTGAVKTLLDTKCVACHKPGGTSPDLSTYAAASAAGAAGLAAIQAGEMPTSGPLAAADQALFAAWVDGGMLLSTPPATTPPANSGSGAPVTPPTDDELSEFCSTESVQGNGEAPAVDDGVVDKPVVALTYTSDIASLLKDQCVACHKAGATSPDLSTFAAAKAGGAASLKRIQAGTMPTSGPLSPADKDRFKSWADAGYPEGK